MCNLLSIFNSIWLSIDQLLLSFLTFVVLLYVAIDNTTDCYVGMEHFLGWDADGKVQVMISVHDFNVKTENLMCFILGFLFF